MTSHRSKESLKLSGSVDDPENAEELKRTRTDIENNITKIQKLIKNGNQSRKDGNSKRSRKEAELVGLIEDLHKQCQSLYALYDRVTGEPGKVVSRGRNRRASVSSSDSEEYFSPEEVDGNKRRSEKEKHRVSDTTKQEPEEGNNREVTELEGKLTSLMKEMGSLSQQKSDLELQVETQAHEVKQLSTKNTELHDQVLELELLLKEEKGVVSNLQEKLKSNEEQAKLNIENLMAQINELKWEAKSLRTQKDEMEEKIKCDMNEASTQREELNVMQQKLDSLCNQNKELEAQMETKREQISEYLIQIESLKENLAEKSSVERSMVEEKVGFLARTKDLELELETLSNQKNELEERLRDKTFESKQLENEKKALQDRNHELKTAMTQRGEEISGFMKEHEDQINGASMEGMALKAEVNAMRLELDTLHEKKSKFEQQNERSEKEYAESLEKMENLNVKLSSQIADQEKTVKDQAVTIERLSAEQKQVKILSNKFELIRRSTERKVEDMADEFRNKMVDNIRLLHQRIHVAEQLNNENKNSCKMTKQRYEQENKILVEKIAIYEKELTKLKVSSSASATTTPLQACDPNVLDLSVLNGLDLAAEKVETQKEHVSKMLCEVQLAKDWIKKRNVEIEQMKDNVDNLKVLLNKKEEQEFLLREKVWNLEAKVSKEGGEKLNLTKAVSQLEKKVGKLEKNLKEKDEDFVSLGEKKREAIRQLCFVVDFYRDRCNYLKDLVTSTKFNNRVRA
ncbi:COP1-interactive protein 1-like [Gastrolobium bilobum]|uniref:COP1-interactive protein 1-like n=1 Tax=Gastrolobium bilobum TaxID=150636 RepID=UPI002AB19A82|nr:COP1-interactive protein 1-like [Gastrolobium bilobum]